MIDCLSAVTALPIIIGLHHYHTCCLYDLVHSEWFGFADIKGNLDACGIVNSGSVHKMTYAPNQREIK